MKCRNCKYEKYCQNWCFGFNYEASIFKLKKIKLKDSIIKLLHL